MQLEYAMARFGRSQIDPADLLKRYALILGKKMGLVAVGWIPVFYLSRPFRGANEDQLNVLMLFAPMIGAVAGLVAGWYMAQDAVEDSSMHGLSLWAILVVAAVLPMWVMDALLSGVMGWPWTFGGFMMLTAATLLGLASAVWMASAQE
jgi:hypothetical protein